MCVSEQGSGQHARCRKEWKSSLEGGTWTMGQYRQYGEGYIAKAVGASGAAEQPLSTMSGGKEGRSGIVGER